MFRSLRSFSVLTRGDSINISLLTERNGSASPHCSGKADDFPHKRWPFDCARCCFKYLPVYEPFTFMISSGVPFATR